MHRFTVLTVIAALIFGAAEARGPASAANAERSALQMASKLAAHYAETPGYDYVLESEVIGAEKTSKGTYRIWFRKPSLFRLKVLQGRHRGSEIAVTPSGRVRARPKGLLGKVVVKSMSQSDQRLRSPRGGRPWDANFDALCTTLREHIQGADRVEVKAGGGASGTAQIDLTYRDRSADRVLREVWTADTAHWLVTGRDVFEDGERVEHALFRDFHPDAELTAKFFDF